MRWRASRPQLKRDPLGGTPAQFAGSKEVAGCPCHLYSKRTISAYRGRRTGWNDEVRLPICISASVRSGPLQDRRNYPSPRQTAGPRRTEAATAEHPTITGLEESGVAIKRRRQ